jgi:hypothetical protein
VGATSVSLGFALGGSSPTEQSVYAFLPVRRCGLKFMLQVSCTVGQQVGSRGNQKTASFSQVMWALRQKARFSIMPRW